MSFSTLPSLRELAPKRYPGHPKATLGEFLAFHFDLGDDEKIAAFKDYLRANKAYVQATLEFLVSIYNSKVQFSLPVGVPPFKAAYDAPDRMPGSLPAFAKRLPRFVIGNSMLITNKAKAQSFFLSQLESMAAVDAFIVCQVKDKNASALGLNRKIAHSIFPNYIPAIGDEMEGVEGADKHYNRVVVQSDMNVDTKVEVQSETKSEASVEIKAEVKLDVAPVVEAAEKVVEVVKRKVGRPKKNPVV